MTHLISLQGTKKKLSKTSSDAAAERRLDSVGRKLKESWECFRVTQASIHSMQQKYTVSLHHDSMDHDENQGGLERGLIKNFTWINFLFLIYQKFKQQVVFAIAETVLATVDQQNETETLEKQKKTPKDSLTRALGRIQGCVILSIHKFKWIDLLLIEIPVDSLETLEEGSFVLLYPEGPMDVEKRATRGHVLGLIEHVVRPFAAECPKNDRVLVSVFPGCSLMWSSTFPNFPKCHFDVPCPLKNGLKLTVSPLREETATLLRYFRCLFQELSNPIAQAHDQLATCVHLLHAIRPVDFPLDSCKGYPAKNKRIKEKSCETSLKYLQNSPFNLEEWSFHKGVQGLIVSGCPGSGKTTLMRSMILREAADSTRLVVVVFHLTQAKSYVSKVNKMLRRGAPEREKRFKIMDGKDSDNLKKKSLRTFLKAFQQKCRELIDDLFAAEFIDRVDTCQHSGAPEWDAVGKNLSCVNLKQWEMTWTIQENATVAQEHFHKRSFYKDYTTHISQIRTLLKDLFRIITGKNKRKESLHDSVQQWMNYFGLISWPVKSPQDERDGDCDFRVSFHPLLCLLLVAGTFLLKSLSTWQSPGMVAHENHLDSILDTLDIGSMFSWLPCSTVRRSSQAICFEIQAVRSLLSYIVQMDDSTLLQQCCLRHPLVVVAVDRLSSRHMDILQGLVYHAKHIFIDDTEYLPSLLFMFILISFIHRGVSLSQRNLSKEEACHASYSLTLFTALSPETHALSKLPTSDLFPWTYRVLPKSFVLRSEAISFMHQMKVLLGSECVAWEAPNTQPLGLQQTLFNNYSSEPYGIFLTSTCFLTPRFAFHIDNIPATVLLEAAVLQVLIDRLIPVSPQRLTCFVMSLNEDQLNKIVPLFSSESNTAVHIEFGSPGHFLGRHCDISFFLFLCSGCAPCSFLDTSVVRFLEDPLTPIPEGLRDSFFTSCSLGCRYSLPNASHPLRLALSRSYHSIHFIGSSSGFSPRHPFSCFSSTLSDALSPENIRYARMDHTGSNNDYWRNHDTPQTFFKRLVESLKFTGFKTKFTPHLNFPCADFLSLLIASSQSSTRLSQITKQVLNHRCLNPFTVPELARVHVFYRENQSTVLMNHNEKKPGIDRQCTLLQKTLYSSLDWDISLLLFRTDHDPYEVVKRLKNNTMDKFIQFYIVDDFAKFDYDQFFVFMGLMEKKDNEVSGNEMSSRKTVYCPFKRVLILVMKSCGISTRFLKRFDEITLLAPIFQKKRTEVFLIDCFPVALNFNQLHSDLSCFHFQTVQSQLTLLYLALQWRSTTPIKILHFDPDTVKHLKEFLYMFMLLNCDKDIVESSLIKITRDPNFRKEALQYYKNKKAMLAKPVLTSEEMIRQEQRSRSAYHQKTFSVRSSFPPSDTIDNRCVSQQKQRPSEDQNVQKPFKKLVRDIHQKQTEFYNRFITTCFPFSQPTLLPTTDTCPLSNETLRNPNPHKPLNHNTKVAHSENSWNKYDPKTLTQSLSICDLSLHDVLNNVAQVNSDASSSSPIPKMKQRQSSSVKQTNMASDQNLDHDSDVAFKGSQLNRSYTSSGSNSSNLSMVNFFNTQHTKYKKKEYNTVENQECISEASFLGDSNQPPEILNTQIIPHWKKKLLCGEDIETDPLAEGDYYLKQFEQHTIMKETPYGHSVKKESDETLDEKSSMSSISFSFDSNKL